MGTITAKDATLWQKGQMYFDFANHIMIWAVSIYITYMCWYVGPAATTWHMWLCTIGYQLLMAEGILALYASNSWTQLHERRAKNHIHWILQVVGAGFSVAGCWVEYEIRRSHFRSIHSMTGIISVGFLCGSLANGIAAMWAQNLHKCLRPVFNKFMHNLLGILTFVVGMVSLIYGYDTGRMRRASNEEIRMALKVVGGITIVLSLIGACRSLLNQLKIMFNLEGKLPKFFSKKNLTI